MAVAAMVFAELSMTEFLQKYGTVEGYYTSFNSAFIKEGLKERFLVDYFWRGLPSEITYYHRFLPPKTISDAYRLAKLEEQSYLVIHGNKNPPLLLSSHSNDLSGIKNNRRDSFDLGYGVSEKEELVANGGNKQESVLPRSTIIESQWDSIISALETLKEGVNKLAKDLAGGNNRVDGNGKESEYVGLTSLNECCEEQVESGELFGANGFAMNKNSERCKEDVDVTGNTPKNSKEDEVSKEGDKNEQGDGETIGRGVNEICKEKVTKVLNQMLASGLNQRDFDVEIIFERKIIGDIRTIDELNSDCHESTEGGLESVNKGNGLVVSVTVGNIVERVEEINELIVHQPLPPGFDRVGIGELRQCEGGLIRGRVSEEISHLADKDTVIIPQLFTNSDKDLARMLGTISQLFNSRVVIRELFDPGGKRVYDFDVVTSVLWKANAEVFDPRRKQVYILCEKSNFVQGVIVLGNNDKCSRWLDQIDDQHEILTHGMEFKNGASHGERRFDIWKWPKRKKILVCCFSKLKEECHGGSFNVSSIGASFISSNGQSVVNGVNPLCGIALLSTPYAAKKGGWVELSIVFVFCVLSFYIGTLLRSCLDSQPGFKSYSDIGEAAFGMYSLLCNIREWLIPWDVYSGNGSFIVMTSSVCKFREWLIPWEVHSDCCGLVRSVTRKPEGVSELVQEHIYSEGQLRLNKKNNLMMQLEEEALLGISSGICSERLLSLKIIQPEAKDQGVIQLEEKQLHFHLIQDDVTWKVYHEFITSPICLNLEDKVL